MKLFEQALITFNCVECFFAESINPVGIYLFKVNIGNTRMCEICSKLTIKTLERRKWHRSDVVIINFEQISHCFGVSIVYFEQVFRYWIM